MRQTAPATKPPADEVKPESWLLLMHQIPPKPGYLRVKIWRRLQALGAVAIKNSVYALPNTDESREDFEWVLREIVKEGGEATLCEARLVDAGARDQAAAHREVSDGRNARADYLKRFHEVKQELPTHYDLVLNTDQLGLEEAVSAVLAVARPAEARTIKHRSP